MQIKKYIPIMLVLLAMLPCSVYAAVYTVMTAEIPVSFFADKDADKHFTAVMETINSAPSPDSDTLKIYGTGDGKFEIKIQDPGTYRYKVYQLPPESSDTVYDDTVYTVMVFVTEDKSREGRTRSSP